MFLKDRQVSSLGCFAFEFWVLRFRDLSASFSRFGCFVFESWVLRFRVLGASFSRLGCFVLQSSFSSASFSKLPDFTSRKIEGPLLAGYQIINIRVGGGVENGYYVEVLLLACLLQGGGRYFRNFWVGVYPYI